MGPLTAQRLARILDEELEAGSWGDIDPFLRAAGLHPGYSAGDERQARLVRERRGGRK